MKSQTCGYCHQDYTDQTNHPNACRHHPQFFFPFDTDKDGKHHKGWQCCHATKPQEQGCVVSPHRKDIQKRYRHNSIAYDYVKVESPQSKEKTTSQHQLHQQLKKTIGLPVQKVFDELGLPQKNIGITVGSGSFVYRSRTLFFHHQQIHFVVYTNKLPYWEINASPSLEALYAKQYVVHSFHVFANEQEKERRLASTVTDLTPD